MPMIPVDTAVQILVGPLIDDTDFKTRETGVAYNAAGMDVDLLKSSDTGTPTTTGITLTTAGANDWIELSGGYYYVELTAAQNNVEGKLKLIGIATGILPFESIEYDVVPLLVYNSLVAGSDNLQVDTIQFAGSTVPAPSVTGRPLVDVRNVDGGAHDLARASALTTVGTNVSSILADTGTDGVKVDMAQALPASPTADTVGDALKQATREEAPKRAVALSDLPFYMVDSTDHVTPETSLSVTAEVSKDGGAFAAAAGSVVEIGSGVYHFDATAADMTADVVVFKFTAAGADPQIIALSTVD